MIKKNAKRRTTNVKQKPHWFHGLRLTFVVCSGLLVSGCENDVEKVNQSNERKANIEEAYKIESYLSQGGRQRAKLVV